MGLAADTSFQLYLLTGAMGLIRGIDGGDGCSAIGGCDSRLFLLSDAFNKMVHLALELVVRI